MPEREMEQRTLSSTLAAMAEEWKGRECDPKALEACSINWIESANGRRVLREIPQAVKEKCNPAALEMVRRAFERHEWPIYLTGPTGTGKTSLAAYCLRGTLHHKAAVAQSDQQWPRWIAWPDFCNRLNALRIDPITILHEDGRTYTADESAWWRRWSTTRTVVVDEIGLATKSDAQVKAMWQLLECRRGLPTIFTGNLDELQLREMFDDRVLSRITQGTWIELKAGGDRRVTGFGNRRFVVGE